LDTVLGTGTITGTLAIKEQKEITGYTSMHEN